MTDSSNAALRLLVPLDDFVPVRVTSHGDMTTLIRFCLEQLVQEPPTGGQRRALVLHTLPTAPTAAATPVDGPATSRSTSRPAAQYSAKQVEAAIAAIPKLVSVLEIIKREYPAAVEAVLTSAGASSSTAPRAKGRRKRNAGLHQYTELTTYEKAFNHHAETPLAEQDPNLDLEAARQELVELEWLTGGAGKAKRPRQRHSPCMLAILSAEPLAALSQSDTYTYQPPAISSKSSKKRSRPPSASNGSGSVALSAGPQTSTPLLAQSGAAESAAVLATATGLPAPDPSAPQSTQALDTRAGGHPVEKRKKPNRRKMRRKKPERVDVGEALGREEAASAMDIST